MIFALLRLLSITIVSSLAAAARPVTTFFAMQITVFVLVQREVASLPAVFELVISIPAIFIVAVLTVLETVARHDPDIAAILRETHIDEIAGACGALGAALLFTALGMPDSEIATLIEEGAAGDVLGTTAETAATEHGTIVQVGVLIVALGVNLALTRLRRHFLNYLYEVKLDKFWAFLESGGIIAVLILLPFLPLLVFGFLVVFSIGLAALTMAFRGAEHVMDQRRREECSQCGYALRMEASLCPQCKAEREPTAPPPSGFHTAMAALRRAGRGDKQTTRGPG